MDARALESACEFVPGVQLGERDDGFGVAVADRGRWERVPVEEAVLGALDLERAALVGGFQWVVALGAVRLDRDGERDVVRVVRPGFDGAGDVQPRGRDDVLGVAFLDERVEQFVEMVIELSGVRDADGLPEFGELEAAGAPAGPAFFGEADLVAEQVEGLVVHAVRVRHTDSVFAPPQNQFVSVFE